MTSENKTFWKQIHLSFSTTDLNMNVFGKDVSPGTAVSSTLGLVRFSYQKFGLTGQGRLSACHIRECLRDDRKRQARPNVFRHFNSMQQSPLYRRTVQSLRRLVQKIQGSIQTHFMRDLCWTKWHWDMPVYWRCHSTNGLSTFIRILSAPY